MRRSLTRQIALAVLVAAGLSAAGTAHAACPPSDPGAMAARTAPLLARLAESPSERAGHAIADEIWTIWTDAPDAKAQDLLDFGMQRIRWGAFDAAETALDDLVAYCPDYAEGYNQRAFARFLKDDFAGALDDLDRTLTIVPDHFAALAGRGLSLLKQGRRAEGFQALRDAVARHPWMSERHLLPPEQRT